MKILLHILNVFFFFLLLMQSNIQLQTNNSLCSSLADTFSILAFNSILTKLVFILHYLIDMKK